MASQQHEDDLHEGTTGYKLSQPKQSLATYQQMVMSSMGARSRPASMSVPAPPPPSPLCDVLGRKYATVVTLADVEELLRLLCSKTNTTIPVSDLAVPRPAEPAPVPPTRADETDDENEANEKITMLTVPGHGGVADSSSRDRLAPASTDAGPVTPPDSAAASLPPSRPRPGCAPTDAGDESLQRYKESLGLGGGKDLSDASDPRVCIIQSLTLETPGRDPVTIDLSVPGTEATLKDHPFTIKEGSRFTMVATFKVQHEVLSGLRYVQVVKRKGVRVGKDSEMLGSYAPNTDKQPLYTKRFQEDEAPSGMLARGHYVASSSFVDDDKKTHLAFEWSFDIAKDW